MVQYIDISREFKDGFDGKIIPHKEEDLPVYCGYKCAAYDLYIKSHHSTYYETSSHLFRNGNGRDTIDTPIEDFFLHATFAKLTGNGGITYNELENDVGKIIQPGDALLVHCEDEDRYFELSSVDWMIKKGVKLLGSNLARYDTGFDNPTGMFVKLFRANIPIIANITNLDKIPVKRANLIVLPLKVPRVCTVPCRAIVVVE